jgi:predicted dehydrogenase
LGASRGPRLRVGVIGLGRLWEARHKPALGRLADRFQVTAVYDQVARRAQTEAASLRCAACDGLASLVGRPDVDVVYLLTPQWFGLHPAILSVTAGKPVYCALPVATDPAGLEELAAAAGASGTPVVPELARRSYPATLRLKELLATVLGPPRLVLGQARLFGFDRSHPPGPTTQLVPAPLTIDPGSYLIDWCRFVFQADPGSIQGVGATVFPDRAEGTSGPDFEGIALEFPGGQFAQFAIQRFPKDTWGEASRFLPPPGFQVFAERGAAWLEMPDRIQWTDSAGVHEERLPLEPTVGEVLNAQFFRRVRGDESLAPTLDDALAVARLVDDLRRGLREGRKVFTRPPD